MKYKLSVLNHSHIPELLTIEQGSHLTPWSEKIISQSFGPRSHNIGLFSVEKNQWQLVGYYFAEHVAGEVSLENMCVDKKWQGRGLSTRLMDDLLAYAESIDAFEMWLEVRESNEPAIGLYQKFGFETVSVRKDYYTIPNCSEKEHALLMKKVLNSTTL